MPFLSSPIKSNPTTMESSSTAASPLISLPNNLSASTSIPTNHRTGTRLPTSPEALQSLLAPFNSRPSQSRRLKSSSSSASSTSSRSSTKSSSSSSKKSPPTLTHSESPPEPSSTTSSKNPPQIPDDGDDEESSGLATNLVKSTQGLTSTEEDFHEYVAQVPDKSRIGVNVGQRVDPKITVRNAWQYLPFLTKQAGNIATSFFSHHLYGPPKKSWGIEMTIFTSIVRDMANYSHLSSINQLRKLMDCGQILPIPKDGIITPVSFKVKRHNLTGFLKNLDEAEDGNRVLTGEWVVSKKTWKRMQNESLARRTKNQSSEKDYSFTQSPSQASSSGSTTSNNGLGRDKVIFFIHGGAYFIMSASTHRPLTISIAKYTECRLFAINYRLAPETKFPGPLHDVVVAYFRLLNDLNIPAKNIIFAGDSAGGGLVLGLLMYLRDEGYPLPSAAMVFSPWCDLTLSCDSWETNKPYDFLPMPKPDDPLNPVKCYLGEEGVKKWITHPYASPLFGDLHGLPPLLIQAGDAEVLRDEVTLLAHKASLHGVKVIHEIYEDCVHVFQAFLFLESSKKALQSMRSYVRHFLPKLELIGDSSQIPDTAEQEQSRLESTRPVETDQSTQKNPPTADRNQAAVDREISSDAHLVDENSQPLPKTLPPTSNVSKRSGSGDDETISDGEEVLSETDGADEESKKPSESPEQRLLGEGSSNTHIISSSSSSNSQKRNSGMSLRGRLPPAMDLETIKNMLLSNSIPNGRGTDESKEQAEEEKPSAEPPPDLKGSLPTLQRHTTYHSQSNVITPIAEHPSLLSGPSTDPQSPAIDLNGRNNHSNGTNQPNYTPGIKYTASPVSLLTPLVLARQDSHPDLKAIFEKLIETPSELQTTVYRQGDEPDPDGDYFFGPNEGGSSSSIKKDEDEQKRLGGVEEVVEGKRREEKGDDDDEEEEEEEEEEEYEEHLPVADFAFQTPGYGFL